MEKERIGEVMAELIGPAEHRNRELVTKQESYERILLEEKTAAATLAKEERADRFRIWICKARAAHKGEADKRDRRKEVAQKDPWEDKVQQGMTAYQRWIVRLHIATGTDQMSSTVRPASPQLGIKVDI